MVFLAFIIWIVLFFKTFISKLKYYKILNGKDYKGLEDLFSFFDVDLWLTLFTWFLPIFAKNEDTEIKAFKKSANRKLVTFYISIPLIFAVIVSLSKLLLLLGYSGIH